MGDVVNGICRGEYVLVLGSDVMLNACEATGNCGDPHRYMLEKVRETMKAVWEYSTLRQRVLRSL